LKKKKKDKIAYQEFVKQIFEKERKDAKEKKAIKKSKKAKKEKNKIIK
jgi:hypothetical protein